jgi:hypothetical protein
VPRIVDRPAVSAWVEESEVAESDGGPDLGASSIVDASAIPLSDLSKSASTALLQSIQLILGDLEASADCISGWTSYLDSEPAVSS